MKTTILMLSVLLSIQAFAVQSTSDQIEQVNGQSEAITIKKMCALLISEGVDLGKGQIQCHFNGNLVTIEATVGERTQTVSANADDKMVVEYFGDSDIHQYTNDQDETLRLQLDFTATGTKRLVDGTFINGYYKADVRLRNSKSQIRVGAFINQ